MKKSLLLLLVVSLAGGGCAAASSVQNVVMGEKAMPDLPPPPPEKPTGVVAAPVHIIMIDVSNFSQADVGKEDNAFTGLTDGFRDGFTAMGLKPYTSAGRFHNDAEHMHAVLASETAQTQRITKEVTVPDAVLHVDWREKRMRGPIGRVGTVLVGGDAELQVLACLWGPDGKLVWTGTVSKTIDRASILTGATIRNQLGGPAHRTGAAAAQEMIAKLKPFLEAARR